MPSVRKMVDSLFPHGGQAQTKPTSLPGTQSSNSIITPETSMLTYIRERTRASTVPILDPNGTPIWLTRLIGQGGQARVFVGERQGTCYAVKSFHRQQVIDEGNAKHVRRELGILSHLTEHFPHPFVVELEWAFGYHRNLFLVMDWCPEDLHSRLTSTRLYRTEGKLYAAQLLAAIHHLHSHCIMHRDIKPSNILIDCQGNIKLTDFGFAIQFDSSLPREMHQTYSRVGTRGYKAPELLSEIRGPISYSSDVYAFGIVFSQILFATMKKKATYYTPDKIPQSRFPCLLQAFLTELTDPIPSARPDAAFAMENDWFSSIDWLTIMRRGYQNPYKPTYKRPLSLTVNLAPIPRAPKRSKRKPDSAQSEDLLTGFNYVAPQHSESGLSSQISHASSSKLSTMQKDSAILSHDDTRLAELRGDGSSVSVDAPLSSGKTLQSGFSPDLTRVAFIDDEEDKRPGSMLKQRGWSWTRSYREKDKAKFTVNAGTLPKAKVRRPDSSRHRLPVPALCRAILLKGKAGISPTK